MLVFYCWQYSKEWDLILSLLKDLLVLLQISVTFLCNEHEMKERSRWKGFRLHKLFLCSRNKFKTNDCENLTKFDSFVNFFQDLVFKSCIWCYLYSIFVFYKVAWQILIKSFWQIFLKGFLFLIFDREQRSKVLREALLLFFGENHE